MFTAEMAREIVANNNERNEIIDELIKETEKNIRYACNRGERTTVIKDKKNRWDEPYVEVYEHFKELGFEIRMYRDGSGYYIAW